MSYLILDDESTGEEILAVQISTLAEGKQYVLEYGPDRLSILDVEDGLIYYTTDNGTSWTTSEVVLH